MDWADRMAQMREFQQRLMFDGITESLLPELDPIRSIKTAFNSAVASAPAITVVYTVPAGKAIVCDNVTLNNREAVAVDVLIYDGAVQIDEVQLNATETLVLPKRYRVTGGNTLNFSQDAWVLGVTVSADFYEFPLANRVRVPPS